MTFGPALLALGSRNTKPGLGGPFIMRTPSRPLFKAYEIAAIVAFLLAGILIGGLKLIY